ncbi:MAG: cysteine dioxygenase family protein [Bdellovibrionota bacterium]
MYQVHAAIKPTSINIDWKGLMSEISKDFSKTREVLLNAGVNAQILSNFCIAPTGNEPYGRSILFAAPDFEIMLATWAPGAICAPHNHGFSNGAVWLIEGTFIESHFNFDQGLALVGQPKVKSQDTLLNVDNGDIHSMQSVFGGVSLHLYSPPIHNMKVFDENTKSTLIVTDDCGAWVPAENKILNRELWQNL